MASDEPDGWLPSGSDDSQPGEIDFSTAHIARVYNYWLGGCFF